MSCKILQRIFSVCKCCFTTKSHNSLERDIVIDKYNLLRIKIYVNFSNTPHV